jgi:hypothetical protein
MVTAQQLGLTDSSRLCGFSVGFPEGLFRRFATGVLDFTRVEMIRGNCEHGFVS